MWSVRGKGRDSSLKKEASHTYILRLSKSRNSILYKKKIKKKNYFSISLSIYYVYLFLFLNFPRCLTWERVYQKKKKWEGMREKKVVMPSVTLSNVIPSSIFFNYMWILINLLRDYIIFIYFSCLQNLKMIKNQ